MPSDRAIIYVATCLSAFLNRNPDGHYWNELGNGCAEGTLSHVCAATYVKASSRHRFTAALLDQLLLSSFQVPHRTLTAYVKQVSGFTPSDVPDFVIEDTPGVTELPRDIKPLPRIFDKIMDCAFNVSSDLYFTAHRFLLAPKRFAMFSQVIVHWAMYHEPALLGDDEKELVKEGFARFRDDKGKEFTIDEPIALLAAVVDFKNNQFSLGNFIKNSLRGAVNPGFRFQQLIGYYLASAFGKGPPLYEIFDFGATVPEWAKQEVDLVSVSWEDDRVKVFSYDHLGDRGGMLCIGKKCQGFRETQDWIKNPSTVLCFPDDYMGPDILLFIRLASGRILVMIVQVKWNTRENFTIGDQANAISTLDPDTFWNNPVCNGT